MDNRKLLATQELDKLHIMRYAQSVMTNPFKYGGIVGSDAFCNRRQELVDVRRAMENGDNLFIYSERRLGKTSLVQKALSELPKTTFRHVYIDLWPTDDEASFIGVFAKAVTQAFTTSPDKMLEFGKKFFNSLRPTVSLNEQGQPQITFGAIKESPSDYILDNVLEVPMAAAEASKKKVVIVLDEFQQVLYYHSDSVERRLRSAIQKQDAVSYIFLGSRKHLIQKMITDRSRPLYRSGGHYPLMSIRLEHWLPFIKSKFESSTRWIAPELIQAICDLTQGHPFYTQHLCHAVWERTDEQQWVSKELIEDAVSVLLDREDYAYSALWDSLAGNQRKLLEALAVENSPTKLFSADFIKRHGLKTPSNVQRAERALLERDFIDHDKGAYFISDRFFRLWLQKRLGHWYYFREQ